MRDPRTTTVLELERLLNYCHVNAATTKLYYSLGRIEPILNMMAQDRRKARFGVDAAD